MSKPKKYFYNIDCLRFIFSIIIVYFHFFVNIMGYVENSTCLNSYKYLAGICTHSYLIVECFFIIAGFFLFQTINNNPNLKFMDFVKNKIARLWPVLAFSLVISVIFFKMNVYTAFLNGLFLQCIGVTLIYKGINWYISPFFWTMIFYFHVLKSFDKKYANLIIALCIYFSIVGNINYFNGGFGRETFQIFYNAGLMRALAGIGIGYFIGEYKNNIKESVNIYSGEIPKYLSLSIHTIVEIFCLSFLIRNFIFQNLNYGNSLLVIIIFGILLFTMVQQKGLVSKLLNNKYIGFCGRYAYSIYIMQQISFFIMQKTIWQCSELINNAYTCISVSLIISIIIGIATYYLIEQPIGRILKQHFSS